MSTDRFLATIEGPATPHLSKGEVADLRSDVSNALARVATEIDGSGAHTHSNKTTLDAVTAAFTTALKSAYDAAVTAAHAHTNKATLDLIQEAFTTALKSTYDGYASGKENTGVAAGLVSGHTSAYAHNNFLSKNAITAGPFTTITGITVTDGQIVAITGS